MFDLGLLLKSLRERNQFTQEKVAEMLNINAASLKRWENNYSLPSKENLIQLADLYHVSPDYLVGWEKDSSIIVEGLSSDQKNLLNTMILEFQSKSRDSDAGLTLRQYEILSALFTEFRKAGKNPKNAE